jgi:hypothetical protein
VRDRRCRLQLPCSSQVSTRSTRASRLDGVISHSSASGRLLAAAMKPPGLRPTVATMVFIAAGSVRPAFVPPRSQAGRSFAEGPRHRYDSVVFEETGCPRSAVSSGL